MLAGWGVGELAVVRALLTGGWAGGQRAEGPTDGRTGKADIGQAGSWKDGWMDGQTDRRKDGRSGGRTQSWRSQFRRRADALAAMNDKAGRGDSMMA